MSRGLLSAFFGIALVFSANALVLKDDYRSPRNPERRIRKATTLVVLHTTEAHAKSSLNKLSERGEAHYCVVEDGTVYRIIDKDREAYHAGRSMWNGKEDCDEYTIGIEVVGHHDKPVTAKQIQAINELVATLQKTYKLKDHQVICHSHVAYGAPNKWHKKKHRGRKRCGMLFAMPSVRARLGLTSRPAYDPDVRAKRLVQGDKFLDNVLYGNVDTMAKHYAKGKAQAIKSQPKNKAPAKPKAVSPEKAKPKPAAKKPVVKPAAKVPEVPAKSSGEVKRGELKKDSNLVVREEPKPTLPIQKGKLIKSPIKQAEVKNASGVVETGEFKKNAKLIKR